MRILKILTILSILVSVSKAGLSVPGSDLHELRPFLRKATTWDCITHKKTATVNIYFSGDDTGPDGAEVIVYMKNSSWERIGKESDLSILSDYIRKKFIVILVDFGRDRLAMSPAFDRDLHEIFKAVYGFRTVSILNGLGLRPREFRCFFLPAGYRVATGLVYWEIDKHGANGTMDYILDSYNEDIVPKLPGLKPAATPADMVDRKGKPFDFTVRMDIVYPSESVEKIPAIVFSAWLAARNPNGEPISYLPHFAGFTTRGYVYVVMGHCFNPCVQHFFHYSKFTLDAWNGMACYSAAMRYINMHAEDYSIDTSYIGMAGHSKGEYAITRLSDPNHDDSTELSTFPGYPAGSPVPQPWPGYPSRIACGYQSMGMGLFEPQYITADYVPNIIACGEKEREVISREAHPAFINRLEELNCNYIDLFMKGLGHEVPYGYDDSLGVDRYRLMHDFFDRYLLVKKHLPPAVLQVSPHDGQLSVSRSTDIIIDFAPVIVESSILNGSAISVSGGSGNRTVQGSWKKFHQGTRYIFTPSAPLDEDSGYTITISRKIVDVHGNSLLKEKKTSFTTSKE